ncbi:MAG: L,D-transpeptidase family protein [Planctomycetota bacterium]
MARFFPRRPGRRRGRNRRQVYITSALLVIAVVIAFIYGRRPSGENRDQAVETSTDVEPKGETVMAIPEANLLEVAPEPTLEPNPEAAKLIAEAVALLDATPADIIAARERLNEALPMPMSAEQRNFVKRQLSELADKWLLSRTIFPQDKLCDSYKVERGDQLRTIGKRFKVPYEILMEINKIPRPEALQAGQTIKVINGPFHARVYRGTFTIDLYLQNTFVRSFPVGLGQPGMETPAGLWVVKPGGKLISPTWTDPISGKTYEAEDPDYPLGSRWIGLEGIKGEAVGRDGFALHGTKEPEEIGTAGSQGCIRLLNGDVILVYNLLVPGHSQVEIVD